MENIEVLNRIKKIKNGIHFENAEKEMNYTIHKFFDFVIHSDKLSNDKMIIKIDKGNRIIPVFINLTDYIKKNSKVWTQEYKVHFDLELSESNDNYFLKFYVDRKTKPKKVFTKEYDTKVILKEFSNENRLQKLHEND